MTCTFEGCTNNKFAPHEECALHCIKSNYQDDRLKGVLSEFYDLLKIYIADLIDSKPLTSSPNLQSVLNSSPKPFILGSNINIGEKIREGDLNDIELRDLIRKFNKSNEITISDIYFPYRDNRDDFDYFKLLNLFSGVHLIYCHLYIDNWQLEDVAVFFDECVFYNSFDITPIQMFQKVTDCLFAECEFKSVVRVSPIEINSIFEDSLFLGCDFKKSLRLENSIFKKIPFLGLEQRELKLSTLEIYDCNFDGGFKLNSMHISYLWIENTNFLVGFWMLKANITTLNCINVVIDCLFDVSNSLFVRAKFNRTKFLDVADFEEVKFGKISGEFLNSSEDTTQFKYVTFMNAANFKNTSFSYGLDFENVDLREQPNFLKSNINPHDTNRETFRIIKYSFDSRGNKIEAGKYHAYEMNAYINELSFSKNFWQLVILHANNLISRFGQSYIIPFSLLMTSIVLYSGLFDLYQKFLQFRTYEIPYGVECMTEWLNAIARNFLPFARFISDKRGFEFVSLFFYIIFAILIWQIIVAVKKQTQH